MRVLFIFIGVVLVSILSFAQPGPTTCDITGYVFNDVDADTIWDTDEPPLSNWEVYFDDNGDQHRQSTEPNCVSNASGFYILENLPAPQTYYIRETIKTGWRQMLPGFEDRNNIDRYRIVTEPNQIYGPCNFGNTDLSIKYGGGQGTAEDPYLIYTPGHMNKISLDYFDWDKHFILMNDIDMSGIPGEHYHPIGCYTDVSIYPPPFTGNFNGNYHVIYNLSCTTEMPWNYYALFGYTRDAVISNLGIVNATVSTTGNYIGVLAGSQNRGTVENCFVTGRIIGGERSKTIGGLAGSQSGTNNINCRSDVDISVGWLGAGIGGYACTAGYMTNCYSSSPISGLHSSAALALYSSTVVSSYWDTANMGSSSGRGTPLTIEQMHTQASFVGWDFVNTWRICEGMNYPKLKWEPVLAGDFTCPDGVEMSDLLFMAQNWLQSGTLTADIAPAVPDGMVNLADLSLLASNWLEGTE